MRKRNSALGEISYIASENWQGIEGSLLARVAAVERERDELAKAEANVRRKAREIVSLIGAWRWMRYPDITSYST